MIIIIVVIIITMIIMIINIIIWYFLISIIMDKSRCEQRDFKILKAREITLKAHNL
jgi:phage shock protein PspC (stress-responsive transcriptional regulator)